MDPYLPRFYWVPQRLKLQAYAHHTPLDVVVGDPAVEEVK